LWVLGPRRFHALFRTHRRHGWGRPSRSDLLLAIPPLIGYSFAFPRAN
jgi:hypothetical protein